MKFLHITEEIEASLVHLIDMTMKAGGIASLAHIDKVRNAIQQKVDEIKSEEK